ncbi:MAG: aspartate aminotransferase family protein [Actinomycetota bacterium]
MDDGNRSPFDPPVEDMVAIGRSVVDFVTSFIDDRYRVASSDYEGAYELARELRVSPPRAGRDLADVLETIGTAAGKGFDPAAPGFLAYIPGGGLYSAAIADFIACSINRYTGITAPSPAIAQLESVVIRWICDLFDYPPESRGILTPGGSMANLSAIITARSHLLGEDFLDGVLYASDAAHHSIAKSAKIAGLPSSAVSVVPTDKNVRMDVAELRRLVDEDRSAGRRPFMVVGSAGTVNVGAVDPLDEIAVVAAEQDLWFHVDGAYGGFFQLTERGRQALRGITSADSITLDPHKTLFLPYGTGSLIVRDGTALKDAHQLHAHYLPDSSEDPELFDHADYSPELTRDFRGLRVWLPLQVHGVDAFVSALDEKLDLARLVYEELVKVPQLEVPWQPQLSLVAFRPRGGTNADVEALLDRINASGRVWLSPAAVEDRDYLRVCIVSHRTRRPRIEECIQIISDAAAELPR